MIPILLSITVNCIFIEAFTNTLENQHCYSCPVPISNVVIVDGVVLVICNEDFDFNIEYHINGTLLLQREVNDDSNI